MTKKLTPEEKKRRKKEKAKNRRSDQKKPKSPTVKTVTQPKPQRPEAPTPKPPTPSPVNLCDDCLYEFGECQGNPKLASDFDASLTGAEADRVVQCDTYDSGEPPADEPATAPTPAVAEESEEPGPDEEGRELLEEDQGPDPDEGLEFQPEVEERLARIAAQVPPAERGDIHRFANDTTDYGTCPTCESKLKRTAYSRYVDAIRCTNPRCTLYRNIVRTVKTGVK